MNKINEIMDEIESLPHEEFRKLIHWIHKKEWDKWDDDLEKDSKAGLLDFLVEEAREEEDKGTLREI